MPKFTTFRGHAPGKMIQEYNDKLHVLGRVYRTSDLSEIVGKPAVSAHNRSDSVAATTWSLRMKRGYQPATRQITSAMNTAHGPLADFDAALCGNWSGVTSDGLFLDATKFRLFTGAYAGNLAIDVDTETGAVINTELVNVFTGAGNNTNEFGVWLPAGPGGAVAMYRGVSNAGSCSALYTYPSGSSAVTAATAAAGSYSPGVGNAPFHYRINDTAIRWYFLAINVNSGIATTSLRVSSINKTTLALTDHVASLANPAGATAVGASGLGYTNSAPSYAYSSGANELSSYLLWRTSTNMEIHRVEIASADSTPVVTNNVVTLDQNPMTLHGSLTISDSARIVLVSHTDGNKYLVIFGIESYGASPQGAAAQAYVYKLTAKNTAQYVGNYQLSPGPRAFLASDDSCLRWIWAYDDRYEFWAMGAGGVLSKVDTIYVTRSNAVQYYEADPYGFDNAGRFWYVSTESAKPANYAELALNFYAPPGQVNTISVTFDSNNYTFSGSPVNGTLSVSVKDITGAYVAAAVNLSPSVNVALQSSQVTTTTSGPTLVPFTINGPGDITVDAWT